MVKLIFYIYHAREKQIKLKVPAWNKTHRSERYTGGQYTIPMMDLLILQMQTIAIPRSVNIAEDAGRHLAIGTHVLYTPVVAKERFY